MNRSIEVELKFEVVDTSSLDSFVKHLKPIGEKHVVDVYLDTKEADFFQKGVFIRIRNGEVFDIKFNKEDLEKGITDSIEHTHCDEVSHNLPLQQGDLSALNETLATVGLVSMSSPSIEDFMNRNGLIESMVLDKQRRSYESDEFRIDIDVVKDLGEYLEIEKMTDENSDIPKVLDAMRAYLEGLRLHYVDTGYNELYWRKHDFGTYLKGKYLLVEDRQKYRPQTLAPIR